MGSPAGLLDRPRPSPLRLSRIAQISVLPLRVDWKTKYLPSGVQLPQHSAGGWFQPGNKGWRFVPSAETSQMERAPILLLLSPSVNRSRLPSGDHRGQNAVSGRITSFRGSVPSLFARYKSRSRTKAISRASGDQVA